VESWPAARAGTQVAARLDGRASASDSPYVYDVSAQRKVDSALVRFAEQTPIDLALDGPSALAVDSDNLLYVAGVRAVCVFAADERILRSFALERPARCLAVAARGQVLVGVSDHVDVYAATGGLQSAWASLGERAQLTSLAVSGRTVYAADCGNRAVWRFDPDGRLLGQIGADGRHFIIPSPYFDVAAAPDNSVWIVNSGRLRLERYSADGTFLSAWGEAAMAIQGFCGCCNPSHIAVMSDGRVVTAEKGLPRVKVYRPDGKLDAVVATPDSFDAAATGLDLAVDSTGRIRVLDPVRRQVRTFLPHGIKPGEGR
jgi:sugar lactone lactonase YvrE